MTTPLDTGDRDRIALPPVVALRSVGASVTIAVAATGVIPRRVYGGDMIDTTRGGKPRNERIVAGVVVAAAGDVTIGPADTRHAATVGELARIHLHGRNLWDPDNDATSPAGTPKSWGACVDDFRAAHGRPLAVGDLVRIAWVGEDTSTPQPRRIIRCTATPAADAARTHQLEQLAADLAANIDRLRAHIIDRAPNKHIVHDDARTPAHTPTATPVAAPAASAAAVSDWGDDF